MKRIYCALLYRFPEFQGFFKYVGFKPYTITESAIKAEFQDKLCANADISLLIRNYPVEKNEIKNCGKKEQTVSADTQTPDEVLSVTYQTMANCTKDEPNSVIP